MDREHLANVSDDERKFNIDESKSKAATSTLEGWGFVHVQTILRGAVGWENISATVESFYCWFVEDPDILIPEVLSSAKSFRRPLSAQPCGISLPRRL